MSTSYKFWGRPPEAYSGLDVYVIFCCLVLFAAQFSKLSRVLSWWLLPLMGLLTFFLFSPSQNYGEFIYQISAASIMSIFAYLLTYRKTNLI